MAHNIVVIAETFVFFSLSFLAGDLILQLSGLIPSQTRIRWVYAVMLGLGIFGVIGVMLGFASFFTPLHLHFLMLVILASSWSAVRGHARRIFAAVRSPRASVARAAAHFRTHPFLKIVILLWLSVNFALAFVPITAHDTKAYHLPIIQDLQKNGRISFSRDIFEYGWAALTGDTLHAIPTTAFFETRAPFAFQIIQYLLLPLLLLVIYEFLRDRVRHPLLAVAGAIMVLGIFDLQREALHGGYTDMLVYLFGIAAALLVVDVSWRDPRRRSDTILSALLLGVALSVKLTAGFVALANALFLAAGALRDRIAGKKAVSYVVLYFLAVFLISGFWYVKNAVVWGNPLYIGGLPLTETMVAEKTLGNLLLFPFLKFGVIEKGHSSSELIVAGYFLVVYAAGIMALFFARKKITLTHLLLFAFTQLQMMIIFFRAHHTRYMLSAIIMLPVLIALIADAAYRWSETSMRPQAQKKLMRAAHISLAFMLLVFFIGNIRYFYVKVLYKTGILTEQQYIKKIGSQ